MFATHRKMMQLLLFYCIVVQSCVLCQDEPTLTPTESSAESEISEESVGRSGGHSETPLLSFFTTLFELFKIFMSIFPFNTPSTHRMHEADLRGKRDTTNEQSVADIELNRKGYDRVLRATDKRDRQQKEASEPPDFLDHVIFSKPLNSPLFILDKNDSKDDLYTLPKEKTSVAFKDGESTIRNKRFSVYISRVTANSRKNKGKAHKLM